MRSTPRTLLRHAAAVAAAVMTTPARAAGPTTAPATLPAAVVPRVVRLTLCPVATAEPAVRYPLLPPLADQHPGDAAYTYMLAASNQPPYWDPSGKVSGAWARFEKIQDTPPGPFPTAEAADLLVHFPDRTLDAAARCDRAHWDADFRGRGVDAVLPYVTEMRPLARVAALRGRLALARGDFAGAARWVQTNLAMVRQMDGDSQVPLVQAMVAAGIENLTLDAVVQPWVSGGPSPNLYWSLSSLPTTFTDLYAVAQSEQGWLRFSDAPWIALAMDDRLPNDQWFRVVQFAARVMAAPAMTSLPAAELDAARRRMTGSYVGAARANLTADGRPRAEVAAMSDDEAVGRYLLADYRATSDRTWRAFTLPFPQAERSLRQAGAAVGTPDHPSSGLAYTGGLRARYFFAAADEHLAALRVIEALRDHAARHGGRPPATLDEVTALPIPTDPVTGRAFDYHASGMTATLDLLAPAGLKPATGTRYELVFASP